MALTTESYRLVEAYYRGELAPAEEEKLRARIREDAAFAADVREWEAVFQAMLPTAEERTEREQLRQRYRKLRGADQSTAATPVRRLPSWLVAAAAVLLVAAVAVWLLRDTPVAPDAPPPVASEYLFMGRANALLGADSGTKSTLERAYDAYDTLNYAAAAPVLLSQEAVDADSLNLLYGGVAYLNLGDTGTAIDALERLLPSEYYQDYLPEINYYLGLAYRAAGREEEARERLTLAAAEPGKYGVASREALVE